MWDYCDGNRGTYQYKEYGKQLVLFEGMKYEGRDGKWNVTPTDIDGLIQLDRENCIIFFELKYVGDMPSGQEKALERLCDAAESGGVHSIAFMAEHNQDGQEIYAKDAVVKKAYIHGRWHAEKQGRTLKEVIDRYIDWVRREQRHEAEWLSV